MLVLEKPLGKTTDVVLVQQSENKAIMVMVGLGMVVMKMLIVMTGIS